MIWKLSYELQITYKSRKLERTLTDACFQLFSDEEISELWNIDPDELRNMIDYDFTRSTEYIQIQAWIFDNLNIPADTDKDDINDEIRSLREQRQEVCDKIEEAKRKIKIIKIILD